MAGSIFPPCCIRPLLVATLVASRLFLPCFSPQLMAQVPTPQMQEAARRRAAGLTRSPLPSEMPLATAVAWAKLEDLCLTPVALKVQDATLDDILTQLKTQLPSLSRLELRVDNPARFTLDLPHTSVGKILQAAATLMDSKLYVFSDHLLITKPTALQVDEKAEGKEWAANTFNGGSGWVARPVVTRRIVDYVARVMGKPGGEPRFPPLPGAGLEDLPVAPLKTLHKRYGDLPPDVQALLQQLVQWPARSLAASNTQKASLPLQNETVLTVSYDDFYIHLEIDNPLQPNPYAWDSGVSREFRQQILKNRAAQTTH